MVSRDDLPARATVDDIFRYAYIDCEVLTDDMAAIQEDAFGPAHYRKSVPGTELILMKYKRAAIVGERPTTEVSVRGGRFTVKLFTLEAFRNDPMGVPQPEALTSSSVLPTEVHTDIEVRPKRPVRQLTWRISAPTKKQPWGTGPGWGESVLAADLPVAELDDTDALRIAIARQAVLDVYEATKVLMDGEPAGDVINDLKDKQHRLYYSA